MSPTKISGLPVGFASQDDFIVFFDNADGVTKKSTVAALPSGGVFSVN